MDDLRYQVDLLTAMNQKLTGNERMYSMICESSKNAYLYINYAANTIKFTGKWDNFSEFRISEPGELYRLVELFDEGAESGLRRLLFIEKESRFSDYEEFLLRDNKSWAGVDVLVHIDETGNVSEKMITLSDVTKLRKRRDELTYMAYYDMQTGLYNRNYFISRVKEFLEKANAEQAVVSVILIDVDDFHKISDFRGIVIGDEVIQNLGTFFKGITGPNIIGSRFDGDIFCLAIYNPVGQRSVDNIYNSLKKYLSEPMKLMDKSEVSVSVSVGVAEYPESSDNALQLINCAEIVMLKAKDAGKATIKYFDAHILDNFLKDVDIETKLKEAVHNTNFFMNFQPQFYAKGNKLRGVEALIRWRDADGSLISPSVFIPLAEKSGLIISIGDYVLEESIKTHMQWKKKFDCDLILSINISSIQYNRPDFVSKVLSAVKKYGMDPEELELEITESVLIDDFKLVIQKMYELRDYGIKVSLDDFGTGFSSLSYLKGLPIDTLKIDKSFIESVTSDEASKVITEAVINMSKRLGFETVAEGVETKEQLDYLNEVSCDLIQGYYLGKPMDESGIEEILLRTI
ncbi:MAG: bifunctional diguanylate cyclase/phosphodiesterase [Lachnospiraceae bacterium]|nr:bifunctional diguanylate cyclase/phosphodiesterase [Lachnospiraceae bacterium]